MKAIVPENTIFTVWISIAGSCSQIKKLLEKRQISYVNFFWILEQKGI